MQVASSIRFVLAALALSTSVLASCTSDGESDADRSAPAPMPQEAQPTEVEGANVFVDVSNQSFDDPDVHITMRLGDLVPVDASFPVEGQHHWVGHQLRLQPGDHLLEFTSDSGAVHALALVVPADAPVYITVSYWADAETPPKFQSSVSDEPFAYG